MGKGAEQPNWVFYMILYHFGGKDWKKYEMIEIEHSKSFWTTLVGKHEEKCEMIEVRHSK